LPTQHALSSFQLISCVHSPTETALLNNGKPNYYPVNYQPKTASEAQLCSHTQNVSPLVPARDDMTTALFNFKCTAALERRQREKRYTYGVLVGKPGGNKPLGRQRHTWENNIKVDLQETGWEDIRWNNLAQ